MNCPVCGGNNAIVVDSRPQPDAVKRRRMCADCDYRFNTYEIDEKRYKELTGYRDAVQQKIKGDCARKVKELDFATKQITIRLKELLEI